MQVPTLNTTPEFPPSSLDDLHYAWHDENLQTSVRKPSSNLHLPLTGLKAEDLLTALCFNLASHDLILSGVSPKSLSCMWVKSNFLTRFRPLILLPSCLTIVTLILPWNVRWHAAISVLRRNLRFRRLVAGQRTVARRHVAPYWTIFESHAVCWTEEHRKHTSPRRYKLQKRIPAFLLSPFHFLDCIIILSVGQPNWCPEHHKFWPLIPILYLEGSTVSHLSLHSGKDVC